MRGGAKNNAGFSNLIWIFLDMHRFDQPKSVCVGQAVDEMSRLGPVATEDQSASLPASVRVGYGRLTEVTKFVHRDAELMHHALLPPALCV